MTENMTLTSRVDGLKIGVVAVIPEGEPRAVLQFSHGLCGCKERYLDFMQFLARRGVACVAGDHRGHGASIRKREDLGYMYEGGYMALVDDMRQITEWIHRTFPGRPVYLLGHSMGSMAARVYTKYDDSSIDGLILTGSPSREPLLGLAKALSGLLCGIGMSRMRLSFSQRTTSWKYNRRFASEGVQAWTCSDSRSRAEFLANPLCNFYITANMSYNILSMMSEIYDEGRWCVSNPSMPIMFISGSDDPLMLGEPRFHRSAQNICDRGYMNVTSAIYPAMRHEVLNEIGKEEVWADILDFMGLKASGQ